MPYIITSDGEKRLLTWMQPYSIQGCNCPKGMTVENCTLRKKLAELQAEYDIGYSVLPNGALSFPKSHYNKLEDKYIDIMQIQRDICDACFAKARQKA